MSEFLKRVRGLGAFHQQTERGSAEFEKLNRKKRRAAMSKTRQHLAAGRAILERQRNHRAGLLMDSQLREFWQEFNGRTMARGLTVLPTSFNVVGAMMKYDETQLIFRLYDEHDHVFSWGDFVDFVTSSDAPSDALAEAAKIAEGEIFAFNAYDDPHDLTFSADGDEYGVGGVSFIRHGDEVSVMLVAGKTADLGALTVQVSQHIEWAKEAGFRKEGITPDPKLKAEPVPLHNADDLVKTIILVRVDLRQRVECVRYILEDHGNSWSVKSDDPRMYSSPEAAAEMIPLQLPDLEQRAVLFNLCRMALLLPAYFAFKVTLVRSERIEPPRRRGPAAPPAPPGVKYDPQIKYKTVPALRVLSSEPRLARRFSAPRFKVEVGGFWRALHPGGIGKGPSGEPVEGRTWVSQHQRWTELPERPLQVLVKSRVAIARRIAAAEAQVKATAPLASEPLSPSASVTREEAYKERLLLTPRLRWSILSRDNFRCKKCGADAASDPSVRLHVDHIHPIDAGGKTEPGNLETLCSVCNGGKGAQVNSLTPDSSIFTP